MVFGEDLPALYHAFHDRLSDGGKKQKLIKCQICCLEGIPSYSEKSSVCEMCFDDDFWQKMEKVKKNEGAVLWTIKTLNGGLVDGTYFAKGQYLGEGVSSVDGLSRARFYQTKTSAGEWISGVDGLQCEHRPKFAAIQIRLTEIS